MISGENRYYRLNTWLYLLDDKLAIMKEVMNWLHIASLL